MQKGPPTAYALGYVLARAPHADLAYDQAEFLADGENELAPAGSISTEVSLFQLSCLKPEACSLKPVSLLSFFHRRCLMKTSRSSGSYQIGPRHELRRYPGTKSAPSAYC